MTESIKKNYKDGGNPFRVEQIGKRWTFRYHPSYNLEQRLKGPPIIPITVLGPTLAQLPSRRVINPKDRFKELLSLAVEYIGNQFNNIEKYNKAKRVLANIIAESKSKKTPTHSQQQGITDSDTATTSDVSHPYVPTTVPMSSDSRISGYSLSDIMDPLYSQVKANQRAKQKRIPNNGEHFPNKKSKK